MSLSLEPELAHVLEGVFNKADATLTQVAIRISENGNMVKLEEAVEIRISNDENPLPFNRRLPINRIEDHDITPMGMPFKKFYIFSLINLIMTIVVIICSYEKVEHKRIYTAFFILSIIFNILTIIITCLKIVEYKKLEIIHQVHSYEISGIFILFLVNIFLTLVTLVYSIINLRNGLLNQMFLIYGAVVVGVVELFLVSCFDQFHKVEVSPDEETDGLRESNPQRID